MSNKLKYNDFSYAEACRQTVFSSIMKKYRILKKNDLYDRLKIDLGDKYTGNDFQDITAYMNNNQIKLKDYYISAEITKTITYPDCILSEISFKSQGDLYTFLDFVKLKFSMSNPNYINDFKNKYNLNDKTKLYFVKSKVFKNPDFIVGFYDGALYYRESDNTCVVENLLQKCLTIDLSEIKTNTPNEGKVSKSKTNTKVNKLVKEIKSEISSNVWESLEGDTDLEKVLYYTKSVL